MADLRPVPTERSDNEYLADALERDARSCLANAWGLEERGLWNMASVYRAESERRKDQARELLGGELPDNGRTPRLQLIAGSDTEQ